MKITVRTSSGRRPHVRRLRPRSRLPRTRGFTRGRVFTVRERGKNRVHTDVGRPSIRTTSARARVPANAPSTSARTRGIK
jgi:hypothetical protein